jgi:hypothetical protein
MNFVKIMEGVAILLLAALGLGMWSGSKDLAVLKTNVASNGVSIARIETTVVAILKKPIVILKPMPQLPIFKGSTTMINPRDLKKLIIQPTLDAMEPLWPGASREAAVNLLIGTVLQESVIGGQTHLKQIGGPALGIFQIEPDSAVDHWQNYLSFRPEKASFMRSLMEQHLTVDSYNQELISNLRYATAMARLKYWRRSFTWPEDPNDIEALGQIWDTHYNANPDHGFVSDFVDAYEAAGEF